MDFNNPFTTKRDAILKAKSTVLAAVVMASIIVSFSIVTLNFLWNLRGYNVRVTEQKEEARDQLEENLINSEQLTTQYQLFEQGDVTSQEVLDALPSKYDYAALVTSVDQLARQSGMLMEGFNGTDETETAVQIAPDPIPIEMEFAITVTGDYKSLQEFVDNLDKSIRPFAIKWIEISGSDNNLKVEMSMVTYYQPATDLSVQTKVIK